MSPLQDEADVLVVFLKNLEFQLTLSSHRRSYNRPVHLRMINQYQPTQSFQQSLHPTLFQARLLLYRHFHSL